MQRSCTGLVCRAHDRFNPSIALWQHFVQANPSKPRDRRQLSTATPAAQDAATTNGKHAGSKAETEEPAKEPTATLLRLRKMTTTKGGWKPNKGKASSVENIKLRKEVVKASRKEREKMLADTIDAFGKSKDYKGVVVEPMVGETAIKESALPWCVKKKEEGAIPGISRLRLEIAKFYEYTTPDRHETLARKHLIQQVRNHLQTWIPEYKVEVFGSERTGIGMPLSDIDFRLVPTSESLDPAQARLPPSAEQRRKNIKILQRLYTKHIRKYQSYLLPVVRHARYPLISAQDRRSGLDIQIVLANDTSISRVIMQDYMKEIPFLRELYWVVKTIFDTRGLSDVFRGGFGSYSLFMMAVASIKHAPHPPEDSAQALLNFLRFWGRFDTTKHGVSIEPAYFYDKAKHPVLTDTQRAKLKNGEVDPLPDYMLSLRDPADETNNLGRKGIAIKHVQITLRALHHQLALDTKNNTRHSLLTPLVGSSYMLQLSRRRRLQEYGQLLERLEQKTLARKAKAMREATRLKQSMPERAVEEEALKKEIEEEETKYRLARELRDREWQRLNDERNEQLRREAEKASELEHSDATTTTTTPDMPAVVEEEPQAKETTT
ncbi:hypothetical protein ACET3X_007581 [Alternaria dauci]|uniref:Poly(A) RNA polymerase mitochondrial-like central palm domain-containing protein n=1 Tax=Alternaria dauci TaxID=48095 RepID=A0ABR3UCD0_9PLEO